MEDVYYEVMNSLKLIEYKHGRDQLQNLYYINVDLIGLDWFESFHCFVSNGGNYNLVKELLFKKDKKLAILNLQNINKTISYISLFIIKNPEKLVEIP